jgi:quercetin dioxygenase-like cupin family protein
MTSQLTAALRVALALGVAVVVAFLWSPLGRERAALASTGAAQSHFVGGEPERADVEVRSSRLRFSPGARSNWHSHGNFQIIMAEEGRGRTQVRGAPIVELQPGTPVYTAAYIVHWHGAAPDQPLIQLTFSSGETNWLEPVSDADYLGR